MSKKLKNNRSKLALIPPLFKRQNKVYNKKNEIHFYDKEKLYLEFSDSNITFPETQRADEKSPLFASLPKFIDIAFNVAKNWLKNWEESFTAAFEIENSYLEAKLGKVPNFDFIREVRFFDEKDFDLAFKLVFKAKGVNLGSTEDGVADCFYYEIELIDLQYASARTINIDSNRFDYIITIKLKTINNSGERKEIALSPVIVPSVEFGSTPSADNKETQPVYTTEIIPFNSEISLTGIHIRIDETNAYRVSAQKLVELWNENEESIKTIVNNYIPKETENKTFNIYTKKKKRD